MVGIAALLGFVVTLLLQNANPVELYLICSNVNAMDQAGLPIIDPSKLPTTPASQIPNSASYSTSTIKHANFLISGGSILSGAGNAPCVAWFAHDYPQSSPYQMYTGSQENTTALNPPRRDVTFRPDPMGGWFGSQQLLFPVALAQQQTYPWALVVDQRNASSGGKPKAPSVNSTTRFLDSTPNASGLLGAIRTDYYANITKLPTGSAIPFAVQGFAPVPHFQKIGGYSADQIDDELTARIRVVLDEIVTVNKTAISGNNDDPTSQLQYFTDVAKFITDMPWGALLFDTVDLTALSLGLTMQIGSNRRISRAASFPSEGFRRMAMHSMLTDAFVKVLPKGGAASGISHGLRAMPQLQSTALNIPVGTLVGRILFPFGISFLLPVMVITLVREKEDRILVMMRMNGLKSFAYFVTHYVHFFIMQIFASVIFVAAGFIFKMELFTKTDPGVYIILLLVWAVTMVAMSFFFSVLFSRSRTALIVVFCLILASVILNSAIEQIVQGDITAAYFLWPPFAFYRALSIVNVATVSRTRAPYRVSDLKAGDTVLTAIVFMLLETILLIFLSFYLHKVLPSEYGVREPWHFVFTGPVKKLFGVKTETSQRGLAAESLETGDSDGLLDEDDDVREERRRVLADEHAESSPLVMKRMRKVYSGGKVAVKDVSFSVEQHQIFGLLGPNGAGKTTLIGILTGLYAPTSGLAWLNGFNIHTQMNDVYSTTGVCPQHDILWPDLTVLEHLLFYARLKGVQPADEVAAAMEAIRQVSLHGYEERLSKGLSGGERRRLSIAISLMGNPGVVFLDEPTTGLDPEVKRVIWNIINAAKKDRTVVLTTHSMEEAEVLCNRIGIMAKGTLRCIGTVLRLKQTYGRGFKLTFATAPDNQAQASAYIESLLPHEPTTQKICDYASKNVYEFLPQKDLIARLFDEVETKKSEYAIEEWGVSQTTLEEVFLRIIQDADADAE